ncbi:MAG: hypothetical protein ACTSUF_11235 [Candidatus Heimdallarchaeaceae archaeon]
MKKINHLIYIPFTGLGIKDYKGDNWFKYRADIFRDYVIKSLKAQTTKDFTVWISFRKEEENNPVTKQIEQDLKDAKLKYILTFDGVMMYDDRGVHHNIDLEERMTESLATLKEKLEPAEWIYKTDLGSDDMFHKEALEEIQKVEPKEKGATYYFSGYIIDMVKNRIAEWNRNSSCSKYTVIYPSDAFFDTSKHLEYVKGLNSHELLPEIFDATKLPDGRYMCGVHRGNISTTWDNKFRGRVFNDIEKKEILNNFGLNEN